MPSLHPGVTYERAKEACETLLPFPDFSGQDFQLAVLETENEWNEVVNQLLLPRSEYFCIFNGLKDDWGWEYSDMRKNTVRLSSRLLGVKTRVTSDIQFEFGSK